MRIALVRHTGFEPAMIGAMLSYGKTSFDDICKLPVVRDEIRERFGELSRKLVASGAGHDKFLEQIQYWIGIQAPLYWWKQFDTYRIGVSKSSESTMHRSWKNGLTQDMFESPVFDNTLKNLNKAVKEYSSQDVSVDRKKHLEEVIITNLPDGYLQTRLVNINAKTLRNIFFQRRNHKLKLWRDFCNFIEFSLPHSELITLEK